MTTYYQSPSTKQEKSDVSSFPEIFTQVFNAGYMAGHHDTVEGCYTDIHQSDIDTYQSDIVEMLVKDLGYNWNAILREEVLALLRLVRLCEYTQLGEQDLFEKRFKALGQYADKMRKKINKQ